MAALQPKEFFGQARYSYRIDLFLQKFKDSDPFELDKGGKVTLIYDKDDYTQLQKLFKTKNTKELNAFPFADKKGALYVGVKSFKKNKEFGGGGGSGAGAAITDISESGQCVYNAAYALTKDFKIEDLKKAHASTMTDVSERNIDKILDLPEQWKVSMELSAKGLARARGALFGRDYCHHRQSAFVKVIEDKFTELNRGDMKQFSNINKWNPADMWIVKKSKQAAVTQEIKKVKTLVQYNTLLEQHLKNNILVGISLKQVKRDPTIQYNNFEQYRAPTYKFDKYTLGKRSYKDSMDTYIFFDGGEIQFRTFSENKGWQGEIKGETASGGKVSGGAGPKRVVGIYCKKYLGKDIDREGDVLSSYHNSFEDRVMKWWGYYKDLRQTDFKDIKSFTSMIQAQSKPESYFVSKYLGTQLMAHVESATAEQKNDFITALLAYASSQSENSGPFIKIYN